MLHPSHYTPLLQVTVLSIADQVLLETPFSLGCLVTNTSSKELHPLVTPLSYTRLGLAQPQPQP